MTQWNLHVIKLMSINTFKETIRNKVLYNILLIVGIIIVLSVSFGEWSVFARVQVMKRFGLATMSLSSVLLAVFIGIGMLGKEESDKTIYMTAVRPISRWPIIIGKFIGLCSTLWINFAITSIFFILSLYWIGGSVDSKLFFAIYLTALEMAVIIAAAVLFSTMTTPALAAIFTIAFYIIGHFNDHLDVQALMEGSQSTKIILTIIYYLLPNLEHFNIRTPVIHNLDVPFVYISYGTLYAALYVTLFLTIASVIFSKKDL